MTRKLQTQVQPQEVQAQAKAAIRRAWWRAQRRKPLSLWAAHLGNAVLDAIETLGGEWTPEVIEEGEGREVVIDRLMVKGVEVGTLEVVYESMTATVRVSFFDGEVLERSGYYYREARRK